MACGFGVLRTGPEEVVGGCGWKTTGLRRGEFWGAVGRTGLKGAIWTISGMRETNLGAVSRRCDWNCLGFGDGERLDVDTHRELGSNK